MKPGMLMRCVGTVAFMSLAAQASGLSDIIGWNIDLAAGRITIGPPDLSAIPRVLRNLPQDVGRAFLNPAGPAIALGIRHAKEQARHSCQAVPQHIRTSLAPFFPPVMFNTVCFALADPNRIAIDNAILLHFERRPAVTLEDVIVFRDSQSATNPVLWAHELAHVSQYRSLGLEGFAHFWTFDSAGLENEASNVEEFVRQRINIPHAGPLYVQTGPVRALQPADYWRAASQVFNPFVCSGGWSRVPGGIRLNNGCPLPIRAVQLTSLHAPTGRVHVFPCEAPQCAVGPSSFSMLPEAPGWVLQRVDIVW